MAGGLVPTCYVSQVGTRPPAILDETLSEQSYTRYLEGKLRETFGFRCSAEARCFSVCPQISGITVLTMFRPHKSHSPVGKTADRPRDYATKSRMAGGLVPTCYVSQVGTRPPAILDETLSEQSYTRYLEGKLRETFGFRCSAEAEMFL